jgi:thiamine-monophosphate kinase
MALALTDDCDLGWIRRFASGLANDQRTFGLSLLGGDTTRTVGALTIAITALGAVPRGGMITRAGAKAGDLVFVTGTIGDAGAGLQLLKKASGNRSGGYLVGRYRRPTPRLAIGRGLARIASAAIDVSDGLIADAGHIADCSGVQIAIDANRVPLSVAFRKQAGNSRRAVVSAVTSGDDYEIAFTCPQRNVPQLADLARKSGVPITAIGRVEKGKGVTLHSGKGRPIRLSRAGYTHF